VAAGFELIADYTAGHPALAAMLGRGPVRRRSCSICLRQAAPCPPRTLNQPCRQCKRGCFADEGSMGLRAHPGCWGLAPTAACLSRPPWRPRAWLQGSGAGGMGSNAPRAGVPRRWSSRGGWAWTRWPSSSPTCGARARAPPPRRCCGARPPAPPNPSAPRAAAGNAQRHSRVCGTSGAGTLRKRPRSAPRPRRAPARVGPRPRARPPRQRRARACGCPPALTLGVRLGSG